MMMNAPFLKHCCRGLIVIASIMLVLNSQLYAARDGSEGEEWLKWDTTTRQAYVRAYVLGLQRGFTKGCAEGIFAVKPKIKGGDFTNYASKCFTHFPISDRDSFKMIDTLTEFYRKYPEQRFLYISDILLDLHAGLSIEQIHEHYTGTPHSAEPVK